MTTSSQDLALQFIDLGFTQCDTGGGCEAWIASFVGELSWSVTDELSLPVSGEGCTLALVNDRTGAVLLVQSFDSPEELLNHYRTNIGA